MSSRELGPLWEGPGKSEGFRLKVPNPAGLIQSAADVARETGDTSHEELLKERTEILSDFLKEKSINPFPWDKRWEFEVQDQLLERIDVELSSDYSPISAERLNLLAFFHHSLDSIASGKNWEIPTKANELADYLRSKGFTALPMKGVDGYPKIMFKEKPDTPSFEVFLGFTSMEEQFETWGDQDEEQEDLLPAPLMISPHKDKISLSLVEALKAWGAFQKLVSHFTDALYVVSDEVPPDMIAEISEETKAW